MSENNLTNFNNEESECTDVQPPLAFAYMSESASCPGELIQPQQLRLSASQRATMIEIGIDVNAIGENNPIVLKFT